MANYQSTHTGAEIDAGIDLLNNNSATEGQVLTANGTGGASWQNASGGGGSLYLHFIRMYKNQTGIVEYTIYINIYSKNATPFTAETFTQFIDNLTSPKVLMANGGAVSNYQQYAIEYVKKSGATNNITVGAINTKSSVSVQYPQFFDFDITVSSANFSDNVIEI